MSRVAAPSIIDETGFLDQLDQLEADPAPEVDVLSAYWDHALRTDAADESRFPVLSAEHAALPPEPLVRHTRSAKPVRPVRPATRTSLETPVLKTPDRVPVPSWPEAPARPERPGQPTTRPVQPTKPFAPVHIDEIGESDSAGDAASTAQPRNVSLSLATLMVVLCLGVGAGSAALVFHDRVAQIVVTWSK